MSADYRLNQHLKMSPNAQVKNLVPENLSDVPPQDEWKLGRFWFNTSIGKLQGVFLKLDTETGLPVEPNEMEIRIVGADALGPTKDGEYWPDGLFAFNEQTKISDAMDEVNEALKDLAPPEATFLNGDMDINVIGGFKTGRISIQGYDAPDQLRMEGVSEGDEINYIITDDGLTATLPIDGYVVKGTPQVQFGRADQGIISVFYDNVQADEGIDLFANFNEAGRDYFGTEQGFDPAIEQETSDAAGVVTMRTINPNKANFRSETGSLTINKVERYNDFKKWQRGIGEVNFGRLAGQPTIMPGRHTFFVEHTDVLSGPFVTNESVIFYDPNKTAPTTTINDFTIVSGDIKYVSGVPFYNNNISFKLGLTVDNAFNYTHWVEPIQLTANKTDAGKVAWNHITSNLKDSIIPVWNDTLILTDYTINYNGVGSVEESLTLKAKAGKVATSWGLEVSNTINMLIDTTPTTMNSSWLKEVFFDEDYRLDRTTDFSDIASINSAVGTWNSEELLEDGEAQQYMGELQIAQRDFNSFNVVVDYTSFADTPQRYYRAFKADGKPNSNGTLKFTSTSEFGTDKDIDVLIKFPGITGWLKLTELFDVQEFTNSYSDNGAGCAINIRKSATTTEFDWSIGIHSTVNSGFEYVIQVVINSKDAKISEIEEISPNWR